MSKTINQATTQIALNITLILTQSIINKMQDAASCVCMKQESTCFGSQSDTALIWATVTFPNVNKLALVFYSSDVFWHFRLFPFNFFVE